MGIAIAGKKTAENNFTTVLTLSIPEVTSNGDFLFATIATQGNRTVVAPTGWVALQATATGVGATDSQLKTYWRIASAEPGSYAWSFDAATSNSGFIWDITGANAASVAASSTNSGTGATITGLSVSTVLISSLVVYVGGAYSTAMTTWPAPAGMAQESFNTSFVVETQASQKIQSGIGTTGDFAATSNAEAGAKWCCQLIALSPSDLLMQAFKPRANSDFSRVRSPGHPISVRGVPTATSVVSRRLFGQDITLALGTETAAIGNPVGVTVQLQGSQVGVQQGNVAYRRGHKRMRR